MLKRQNGNNLSNPPTARTVFAHNVCFSSHFSTNILALYKHSFRKQGCFFYGSLSALLQTNNMLLLYFSSLITTPSAAYIALVITVELIHGKKSFSILSSPAGISLTKLSLGGNNLYRTSLFPLRQRLVSDIPAGDGNIVKLFLRCSYAFFRYWCEINHDDVQNVPYALYLLLRILYIVLEYHGCLHVSVILHLTQNIFQLILWLISPKLECFSLLAGKLNKYILLDFLLDIDKILDNPVTLSSVL